jgi:Caspase domain
MRKAVFIGINNYNSPNHLDLKGCINDASSMCSLLEMNEDATPNFDVELFTDVQSKGELTEIVYNLFSNENDIALLYFSGHGAKNNIDTYLVTPDAEKFDLGLSVSDILKMANECKSKNRIIILDCCHSGALGNSNFLGQTAAFIEKGVTILTASKHDELSMEVNGHGVFTNLLLDALRGGAADIGGNITPGSIYAYIDKALGEHEQRPVFKTNITEFTSLRRVESKVSEEIIRKLLDYFPNPRHQFKLDPSFEDTNSTNIQHLVIKPYAQKENVSVFKNLQRFQAAGLVIPVDAPYMYFAAMESKSCKLTPLGHHYWLLVYKNQI